MNKIIENSYNKAANSYDRHSVSQKKIVDKLITYLPEIADKVLDVGCGTGYLAKKVINRYKNITLVDNSNKMLEIAKAKVPFSNTLLLDFNKEEFYLEDKFDLVISCSSLHWANDFEQVLKKLKKSISKHFIFSVMLDGTLKEIREIRSELSKDRIIKPVMHSHNYYLDILKMHGFKVKHSEQMQVVIKFKTVEHALRHLRKTGVNASSEKLNKRDLLKLINIYERRYQNPIPMSFKAGIYVTEI